MNRTTNTSNQRTVYIYALCEPDTNEIRYIGQTVNLQARLHDHKYQKNGGNEGKREWLRELGNRGLKPVVRVLAEVSAADAETAEGDAIAQAITDGAKLLNRAEVGHTRTKHHIFRMNDEHWAALAEACRRIVPAERLPAHANPLSDWQITEGLRMIASGEITLTIIETPDNDR